jgi:hypothetical protein
VRAYIERARLLLTAAWKPTVKEEQCY